MEGKHEWSLTPVLASKKIVAQGAKPSKKVLVFRSIIKYYHYTYLSIMTSFSLLSFHSFLLSYFFSLPKMFRTLSACVLVSDGPASYAFTSSANESIICWDLRVQKPLYELATGNTQVNSLIWDSTTRSLVATTECVFMDRMGGYHSYGECQQITS